MDQYYSETEKLILVRHLKSLKKSLICTSTVTHVSKHIPNSGIISENSHEIDIKRINPTIITQLQLSEAKITGELSDLSKFPNSLRMWADHNKITDINNMNKLLTKLELIDLSHNEIVDLECIDKFGSNNSVKTIDLSFNKINVECCANSIKKQYPFIRELNLSNNFHSMLNENENSNTTYKDDERKNGSLNKTMINLQILDISNTNITNLQLIDGLKNLKVLRCKNNNLATFESILPFLIYLNELEEIDFTGCLILEYKFNERGENIQNKLFEEISLICPKLRMYNGKEYSEAQVCMAARKAKRKNILKSPENQNKIETYQKTNIEVEENYSLNPKSFKARSNNVRNTLAKKLNNDNSLHNYSQNNSEINALVINCRNNAVVSQKNSQSQKNSDNNNIKITGF